MACPVLTRDYYLHTEHLIAIHKKQERNNGQSITTMFTTRAKQHVQYPHQVVSSGMLHTRQTQSAHKYVSTTASQS